MSPLITGKYQTVQEPVWYSISIEGDGLHLSEKFGVFDKGIKTMSVPWDAGLLTHGIAEKVFSQSLA